MNPAPALEAFFKSPDGQVADITCVGPSPFENVLSLGFDDGTMRFLDLVQHEWSIPHPISPSQEAVNGFAAIPGKSLAVSTPADVSFLQFLPDRPIISHFPHGAHGVIATPSGTYVAPLGHTGLLFVQPMPDDNQEMHVSQVDDHNQNLYYYRAAAVHDHAGNEYLGIAHRNNGIGIMPFTNKTTNKSILRFQEEQYDFVDACSVSHDSLELLAVTTDGKFYYFSDVSTLENPKTILIGDQDHLIYSMSIAGDHIILHENRKILILQSFFSKLRSQALSLGKIGESDSNYEYTNIPIEAADIYIHANEYILAVMGENAVQTLSISQLLKNSVPGVDRPGARFDDLKLVPFNSPRQLNALADEKHTVANEPQAA